MCPTQQSKYNRDGQLLKLQVLKHLYDTDHQCLLDRQELSLPAQSHHLLCCRKQCEKKLFTLTYHLQKAASLSSLLEMPWMDTHKTVCWAC